MTSVGLQRNKQKMRTTISDVATGLFIERGFDNVTIVEIAEAAGVSAMTVFNYFPKKEDLFFDRRGESVAFTSQISCRAKADESPIGILRRLTFDLLKRTQESPAELLSFWCAVVQSDSLQARARELRDHSVANIANLLADSVGRSTPDAEAQLISFLLIATWQTALMEGIRLYREGGSAAKSRNAIRRILYRGLKAVSSAAAGTPYG